MKNAFILVMIVILSGCGAGQDAIPEKFDLSTVLWKWTAEQAQCQHITEVGSGLTTGSVDTVRYIKKKNLELTPESHATLDYVAYSDAACTLPVGAYRELYNIQEWVIPSAASGGYSVGALLIYLGRTNQEGTATSFGYNAPVMVKALFIPSSGKLAMHEDINTTPNQLDAEGYPNGASEASATFVRP